MLCNIPSHCETATIMQYGIMLTFPSMVVPFRYKVLSSNADDFWFDYCFDCPLRALNCRVTGALSGGFCARGKKIESRYEVRTVQMPIPRHVLIFGTGNHPTFLYEDKDGELRSLRISNIDRDGDWCAGELDYDIRDPLSVYSGYFNSVHTSDYTDTRPYDQYIEGLANGTLDIERTDVIDIESRFGTIRTTVQNPTQIEWSGFSYIKEVGSYARFL